MFCKDGWKVYGLFFVVSLVVFSWSGVDFSELGSGLTGFVTSGSSSGSDGGLSEGVVVNDDGSVSVFLEEGWNLVSVPFVDCSISSGCGKLWAVHFNASREFVDEDGEVQVGAYDGWLDVSEMKSGRGYWVYFDKDFYELDSDVCSLSFSGTEKVVVGNLGDVRDGKLKEGVNHVGGTFDDVDLSLSENSGDCVFVNLEDSVEDGILKKSNAYWLEVEKDCQLGLIDRLAGRFPIAKLVVSNPGFLTDSEKLLKQDLENDYAEVQTVSLSNIGNDDESHVFISNYDESQANSVEQLITRGLNVNFVGAGEKYSNLLLEQSLDNSDKSSESGGDLLTGNAVASTETNREYQKIALPSQALGGTSFYALSNALYREGENGPLYLAFGTVDMLPAQDNYDNPFRRNVGVAKSDDDGKTWTFLKKGQSASNIDPSLDFFHGYEGMAPSEEGVYVYYDYFTGSVESNKRSFRAMHVSGDSTEDFELPLDK